MSSKKRMASNLNKKKAKFQKTYKDDVQNEMGGIGQNIQHRRMYNEDLSSCWLNCCLQAILAAVDRSFARKGDEMFHAWDSHLGNLLIEYKNTNLEKSLRTSDVRKLLVEADVKRRKNEENLIKNTIPNPEEQRRAINAIQRSKLDLEYGQQDSRDFFIALSQCKEIFKDVYDFLKYSIYVSTTCLKCKDTTVPSIQEELYREIDCPRHRSNLKEAVIDSFMSGINLNDRICPNPNCYYRDAVTRSQIHDISTAEYLTVILQRTKIIDGRETIVENEVHSTDTVVLFDSIGIRATYEPIAVIQHQGSINIQGQSSGHYTADIKNGQQWFRTSDNDIPVAITPSQVSKTGYIIILAR